MPEKIDSKRHRARTKRIGRIVKVYKNESKQSTPPKRIICECEQYGENNILTHDLCGKYNIS
jgi:hypothetical protein